MKKKAILGILILVVLSALLFKFLLRKPFLYAGTLEATKVDLSSRLSAVINAINVNEGDRVAAGQVLVVLGCEDYKVAAELAKLNYERNIKLLKPGFVTPESIDQLRTKMQDADIKVGWCTISSPIDGKVLSRYHEPGEWMIPGTKILTLANIKDIWAYIYVPQPIVGHLSLGMQLKGYVPELKSEFVGKIIKINDEAEFTPKNVQTRTERERLIFGVKISFLGSNANEILKPGMTIEVEIPESIREPKHHGITQ